MLNLHKRPFILQEIKIEVTNHCTLNCVHCSSDAKASNRDEISLESCRQIVNDFVQLGGKELAFSGGEPLTWPDLAKAIETASGSGLDVTIYTSGNVKRFADNAKMLKDCGARRLIFSLFGSTSASHERTTRISGSYNRTLQAISTAQKLGLNAEIHFVPMSTNYRELTAIAILAKRIGISVVSVLRLVPQGRASLLRGRMLNRVQNVELSRIIRQLRRESYQIRTGSPYNFLALNDDPACCAGINRLLVGHDLYIYPCDAFKQIKSEEIVGVSTKSSLEDHSLKECWEESLYLGAIREYLTSPFEQPCENCNVLEKCLSGCLAQKVLHYNGLLKSPDPDCLRQKNN